MDKIFIHEVVDELETLMDMVRWTFSRFNSSDLFYGHGTDNPWDESKYLVYSLLNLPFDLPDSFLSSKLTKTEKSLILEKVIKRINERVPVPYLTNRAFYRGYEFFVNEHVLIPRSPIGEIIEKKLDVDYAINPSNILDLCSGSGCIGILAALKYPNAEVDLVDISEEAIKVCEENIHAYNLEDRVFPIISDLYENLNHSKYDIILTNPPYVDQEDMESLPEEFIHEPRLALEAGEDGLILVKNILRNSLKHLNDDGLLICEVGNSMVHMLEQFPNTNFNWVEFEQGGHGVFIMNKDELSKFLELNKLHSEEHDGR